MPKTDAQAEQQFRHQLAILVDDQGWNDNSMASLAVDFIVESGAFNRDAFLRFCRDQQEQERDGTGEEMPSAPDYETPSKGRYDVKNTLKQITEIAGNLSDDQITTRTGANDAVARGELVVLARKLAQYALDQIGH